MCVLLFFVKNALASSLNSRMSAATSITPAVVSADSSETLRQKKLFRFYPEVVNYLLKKCDSYKAIDEMDSAILQYN